MEKARHVDTRSVGCAGYYYGGEYCNGCGVHGAGHWTAEDFCTWSGPPEECPPTLPSERIPEAVDPGRKYDTGKLRYDLVPQRALAEVVKAITHGARKYGDNNWQKVEPARYVAAFFRHAAEWCTGKKYDDGPEGSGAHSLACAAASLFFLISRDVGFDPHIIGQDGTRLT